MNEHFANAKPLILGKIGYVNVLPIYHPLESGIVRNEFAVVTGPPAVLNQLMREGRLDISSCSSIEYARAHEQYLLVPDLAIGSRGPVQSVLLLSRRPIFELGGGTILVSAQTHTSAALLRILLDDYLHVQAGFEVGDATDRVASGDLPEAILAIGDEALYLRSHPAYPHKLDLGEAWRRHTGLPFIFGVWVVSRKSVARDPEGLREACAKLLAAKRHGATRLDEMAALAARKTGMAEEEMCSYFQGLVYDLDVEEIRGLRQFYAHLARARMIKQPPPLEFIPL